MWGGTSARPEPNSALFLPYFAPYLVYVGIAQLPADWVPPAASYALRIVGVTAALAFAWRRYPALVGPRGAGGSVALGAGVGLVGSVVWIGLLVPFVERSDEPWMPLAFGLRMLAASVLVPVFEELCMRGYVLRFALLWERAWRAGVDDPFGEAAHARGPHDVRPGEWTGLAVAGSTLLFTLGHAPEEWLAAIAYGLLMCALWIRRRDLLSCIVAHATTNATLAIFVLRTGHWELW